MRREQARDRVAGIDTSHRLHRLHDERCHGEECDAQRDLQHDQRRLASGRASAADAAHRGVVEGCGWVGAKHAKRGDDREDERRHKRQGGGESDDSNVERKLTEERLVRHGSHGHKAAPGNGQAQCPTCEAEDEAFADDLCDDASAAAAERGPHRQFLAAGNQPRNQQVHDVRACEDEQKADDRDEH